MTKFISLVLSGAVTGAIYSMMASGLVLTYTTSGIFNFAHGAIAFAVAYLYYQLNTGLGVPIVPALVISVFIFAPLLGYLLDRLIFRRLSKAPAYARVVGTIGLLVALPALMQWLVVTVADDVLGWGLPGSANVNQGSPAPGIGPTPADVFHVFKGVALNSDQLAVFIAAALTGAGLWFVLHHTRLGLDMRAVVDRDSLSELRGIDSSRTSSLAWIISTMMAALGGVLIAPLFGLQDGLFTLVVLGSLAAVVVGGLRSLPIAFLGGIAMGIIQDLVAGYNSLLPSSIANLAGLRSAVPYLLVLFFGLIVGRDRSRQAGSVTDERPPVDHRAGLSAFRRRAPWVVFVGALLVYSMGWISGLHASSYGQTVIAQGLAMAIIFLSFVIVTGIGGMVSLAQVSFATAGGLAAGWALNRNWGVNAPFVATHGHLNFVWAAVIGTLAGAALGLVVAIPAVRLGALYLALWSLSAAFFLSLVVFGIQAIGHGDQGWPISGPVLNAPGLNWLHHLLTREGGPFNFNDLRDQILLFLAIFGVLTAALHSLIRSPSGRAMFAVRSSRVGAMATGIRANRMRIMIFGLAAGVAGLGGVMLSLYSFAGTNSSDAPLTALLWLSLAVLFGIRRPGGALLAGLASVTTTAILHWLTADVLTGGSVNTLLTSSYFVPILSGLGAIYVAQEPDGLLALAGSRASLRRRSKELRRASKGPAAPDTDSSQVSVSRPGAGSRPVGPVDHATEDAALVMSDIAAGYGDVEVLHGVTLVAMPGEILAVLGANGAGKSTSCSVAAGLIQPHRGRVVLNKADITAMLPHLRARAGLLLVPEARGIFPGLTVEENLAVQVRNSGLRSHVYERYPILANRRRQPAGLLSGGEQQILSLASVLVDPPSVLIADEPTLGLAPLVAQELIRTIVELRDLGTAVILVEERAQTALEIADKLAFMDQGMIVWSGPREETDIERLGAAYLGGQVF